MDVIGDLSNWSMLFIALFDTFNFEFEIFLSNHQESVQPYGTFGTSRVVPLQDSWQGLFCYPHFKCLETNLSMEAVACWCIFIIK